VIKKKKDAEKFGWIGQHISLEDAYLSRQSLSSVDHSCQ
jgi:hypothetical protein